MSGLHAREPKANRQDRNETDDETGDEYAGSIPKRGSGATPSCTLSNLAGLARRAGFVAFG